MAFRFALESVLRLRASVERQEQARLEIAARNLYSALTALESARGERDLLERKFRAALQTGIANDDLHYYLVSRAGLEQEEQRAEREAVRARQSWEEQRVKFLRARQDREVIASVRQRQHKEYREQQARHEQQQIDDLFSIRRNQPNG